MRTRNGEKFKLESVEELLGIQNEESAMDIEIEKICPFRKHPFKVIDDEKMQELVESIKTNGVHAAKLAGLEKIPTIIREMTDDEAVICMVDANVQREELLPSEKAFAYKMKLEAMKRRAGRPSQNNVSQNGTDFRSDELLAKQIGSSRNQIQRYIRLTELIPDLLELVDKKKLQFTVAVEISYIDEKIQQWLYEYIRDNGFIKLKQISALREHLKTEKINQQQMITLLNENMPGRKSVRKVTLSEDRLSKYFPPFYSQDDMEKVLIQLLEIWKQNQTQNDE